MSPTNTAPVLDGEIVETPTTALAPAGPKALAAVAPSAGRGKDVIDDGDVYLSRLTLAQLTSDQIKPRHEAYIDGLKPGEFFNSVTQDVYGPGPLVFAVIGVSKRAAIFDEAGKPIDRDVTWDDPRCVSPGEDANKKWIKPEATRIIDFAILRIVDGKPAGMIALSCKKTAFKHGKRLLSIIRETPGDMWDVLYKVEARDEKSKDGKYDYFVPKFSYASNRGSERQTPEAVRALCSAMYNKFVGGKVTAAEDTAAEPEVVDDVPY